MDATKLLIYALSGLIGLVYFMYGRKQRKGVAAVAGILIASLPYMTDNLYVVVIMSIIAAVVPFYIRY